MKIKVKYFNIIASALNCKFEERSVRDETTIRELVETIAKENECFRQLAMTGETEISHRVRLFCNNRIIQNLDERIHDGDIIAIFPAVSGG